MVPQYQTKVGSLYEFFGFLWIRAVWQAKVLIRPGHHHRDLAADVQRDEVIKPGGTKKQPGKF
jgi:hypothetical protein